MKIPTDMVGALDQDLAAAEKGLSLALDIYAGAYAGGDSALVALRHVAEVLALLDREAIDSMLLAAIYRMSTTEPDLPDLEAPDAHHE